MKYCAIVLLLVFVGCSQPQPRTEATSATPPDGSVIFWEDGWLVRPIYRHTGSHLTHAAIVLDGCVYEAVPPCVHKVPYREYVEHLKTKRKRGFTWFVMVPKKPYTERQVARMFQFASSQLGRKYQLRGYDRKETKGVFCSMLVANILERSGLIVSANFRESPGSLFNKLREFYGQLD